MTEQAIEVGGEIKHKKLKGQVFENREERYALVSTKSRYVSTEICNCRLRRFGAMLRIESLMFDMKTEWKVG